MPLRDHFRPPVSRVEAWEAVHGGWPMAIVQQLFEILPPGYVAAPRIHRGSQFEIDVATYERDANGSAAIGSGTAGIGGLATAVFAPPEPTLEIESELAEQDEYEVLIYDETLGRTLVAAIELVSPANKDRVENRRAFVTKCRALLQKDVSVSVVDLITTRHFNLYAELLESLGAVDPAVSPSPPPIYAVTCRARRQPPRSRLATWVYPLEVGRSLPTEFPIWLSEESRVLLNLDASYEETCRVLHL